MSDPKESIVTTGDIRAHTSYFLPQVVHLATNGVNVTGSSWQNLQSFTLPAGTLNDSSAIRIVAYVRRSSGGGAGAFRLRYGGSTVVSMSANGNNPARLELVLFNTTDASSQRGFIDHSNSGNTGTATGTSSVDSESNQTLSLEIDLSTIADDWICDYLLVELVKK